MSITRARVIPIRPHDLIAEIDRAQILAWTIPVSEKLCLAVFDVPGLQSNRHWSAPLDGTLNGVRLPRPVISTKLQLRSGCVRHVVVLRHPVSDLAKGHLSLSVAGRPVAFVDPAWLQSPIRDQVDLVDGITVDAASRLIRLMLSSVPSLFGGALGEVFREFVRGLLQNLHVPQARLASRCPVGTSGEVLSYRLPVPLIAAPTSLVALPADRIDRLNLSLTLLETETILHVFLPGRTYTPPDIVVLGANPMLLSVDDSLPKPEAFLPWLVRRPDLTRQWGDAVLQTQGATDASAEALMRERMYARGGQPEAKLHLLASTRKGMIVWLDVTDPHRLVTALRIETPDGNADVSLPESGQIRAFVRIGPMAARQSSVRLRYVFGSGRISTFRDAIMERFAGNLPVGIATDAPDEAGLALAEAWQDREGLTGRPRVDDFGLRGPKPRLSVIVPLAESPDLVRARAALVASEEEQGDIEVIYTWRGVPSAAAHRLMRETAEVYAVAHRMVSLPADYSAADLLIAALGVARAPAALLLGREVLPTSPAWAAHWIARLSETAGPAIIGGTLLASDGSVEHAGGHLFWVCKSAPAVPQARGTGLPAVDLADVDSQDTDLLTADAAGLNRIAMRSIVADGANCADPSAMLQRAAVRLGACTDLRGRLVRYAPTPVADPVVEASGRWQMGACLAAAMGPDGR